jgi:hypothetical protein
MSDPMRQNHLICSPKPIIAKQSPTVPNGGYSRSRPTVTATVGGQLCQMIWVSYDRGRDVGYLYEF